MLAVNFRKSGVLDTGSFTSLEKGQEPNVTRNVHESSAVIMPVSLPRFQFQVEGTQSVDANLLSDKEVPGVVHYLKCAENKSRNFFIFVDER